MSEYLNKLNRLLKLNKYSLEEQKEILEYATRLLDNGLPVIFDLKHFSKVSNIPSNILFPAIHNDNLNYHTFKVYKKSGNFRLISAPTMNLKRIQRWILDNILYKMRTSKYSYGFEPKKSIVDNASIHVGMKCVYNTDITDFFPSILFDKVFRIFNYYGYTKELSYYFAKLCTFENGPNRSLPQGAPTSPYLANIVCLKLDKRLGKLAESLGLNYSRYADDITISGNKSITRYKGIINDIITDEGFKENKNKRRMQYSNRRQTVTGLVVNDQISIPNEYLKELRKDIYMCQQFGVESHIQNQGIEYSNYKEYLYGKALFVKMVNQEKGFHFLNEINKIQFDY